MNMEDNSSQINEQHQQYFDCYSSLHSHCKLFLYTNVFQSQLRQTLLYNFNGERLILHTREKKYEEFHIQKY